MTRGRRLNGIVRVSKVTEMVRETDERDDKHMNGKLVSMIG